VLDNNCQEHDRGSSISSKASQHNPSGDERFILCLCHKASLAGLLPST